MEELLTSIIASTSAIVWGVELISQILRKILRIDRHWIQAQKSLIKFRIVLKDSNEKLYTLIQEGECVMKATYDSDEQIITYSDLGKSLHVEKNQIASSAESLVFNFAYNSTRKITKSGSQKARVSKETDLIGKLLKKKAKESTITLSILFVAFLIEIFLYFFVTNSKSTYVLIFLCIMFWFAFSKQIILQFRVKKGLYGTWHSEAREIIAFIADYKKSNGTGLGKTELIFQDEDEEQEPDSFILKNLNRGEQRVHWD